MNLDQNPQVQSIQLDERIVKRSTEAVTQRRRERLTGREVKINKNPLRGGS